MEIIQVCKNDLPACLTLIRESFATVARMFGLTRENCPGHTSFLTMEKLRGQFDAGFRMFLCRDKGEHVGFYALSPLPDGAWEMRCLAVPPAFRHRGFGRAMLNNAKDRVRALGGSEIRIGIIEESAILKAWYERNGFVSSGSKRFAHLPFTVGFLSCPL